MSWLRDKKLSLAKKARRGDTDYLHAQLLLAGGKVVRDEIGDVLTHTISMRLRQVLLA